MRDSPVHIMAAPPDSGDAVRLMRALDDDLRGRYPGIAPHGLRPEDVSDPRLAFLVARADGEAIGCGAVRELEPGVGEVKRMFVQPSWRRRGVARQLLAALEIQARSLGYVALRIETAVGQPEAIGLYRSAGYVDIPLFGEYIGNPVSVCFQKRFTPQSHTRRPRYPGRNPRGFHDKYKELNPERYVSDVRKVLASGKTPAGTHRPIMVEEVLRCLRPRAGDVAVDCTLGGGGHARAILERVQPGGRLIGLDVDPLELPRAEAHLRAAGFGPETFVAHHANFAGLPRVLAAEGLATVDLILADLGVSSMQLDNPDRGFSYKEAGPLDMRMNPSRGESASQLLARVGEEALACLLQENADEPHARLIASLLKQQPVTTTHVVDRLLRAGLTSALPNLAKADVKMSVRRTFQALRIAVNDEFSTLDGLLRSLPQCLAPGGRVVMLTFHSGEDRRVKKAFQAGYRSGVYADVADEVIRSTMEETRANRRASSAKLRWAVRGPH